MKKCYLLTFDLGHLLLWLFLHDLLIPLDLGDESVLLSLWIQNTIRWIISNINVFLSFRIDWNWYNRVVAPRFHDFHKLMTISHSMMVNDTHSWAVDNTINKRWEEAKQKNYWNFNEQEQKQLKFKTVDKQTVFFSESDCHLSKVFFTPSPLSSQAVTY